MTGDFGVTIAWAPAGTPPVVAACRGCAAPGNKPVLLEADAVLPEQAPLHVRFLACPACGCAFAAGSDVFDYTSTQAGALGVALYAEAGAGVWPIVRTLARLRLPPGARYLEVGCGLGFGLDFASRAKGWQVLGVDPSPIAEAGRDLLDVPIESRYFGRLPGDAEGPGGQPVQAILASEVLEHIEDPLAFLAMLRGALAPDGVLVLTTPDRAGLRPDVDFSSLVPLLSVGAHLVLFTEAGLRGLLARAGFGHVWVQAGSAQLVAYASAVPLWLEHDPSVLRASYRAYLGERTRATSPGTSLWWGFAGRAYQEAVADEDSPAAAPLWRALRAACLYAYGFDPERAEEVPRPAYATLAALSACVPKALPGLLYARALDRLHGGEQLGDVAGLLGCVAPAADALSAVLLQLGAIDLGALAASRAALAALAALAADGAAPDCLDALARAVAADPDRVTDLARKSFVGLVNAGDLARARQLRGRWDIDVAALESWPGGLPMPALARDALFCLAMVDLQAAGAEAQAMRRFAGARAATPPQADGQQGVWWAALRGECIAADRLGNHAHTTGLLRAAPTDGMPADLRARLDG